MKRLSGWNVVLSVLGLVILLGSGPLGAYSGGSGTEADPFQISTPADLAAIGQNPLDWDKHFILTANLDMSYYDGSTAEKKYNPIGTMDYPFNGYFDGSDLSISNLTIGGSHYPAGLFGYFGPLGVVNDLGLIDVDIDVDNNCVGALSGLCLGKVIKCYSTGIVSGSNTVGGLVGQVGENDYISPEILLSYSEANVNSNNGQTGGLVGWIINGRIAHCYATGNVSSTNGDNTGGLVGQVGYTLWNPHANISYSYATGNVMGDYNVGGLVGLATRYTSINNSYSNANVQGINNVGIILPKNWTMD